MAGRTLFWRLYNVVTVLWLALALTLQLHIIDSRHDFSPLGSPLSCLLSEALL
jgi:hypothetical protein